MPFAPPPARAAWRHHGAREGFEVAFVRPDGDGWAVDGTTTAVQDGQAWTGRYAIRVGPDWTTRRARVGSRSAGRRPPRAGRGARRRPGGGARGGGPRPPRR